MCKKQEEGGTGELRRGEKKRKTGNFVVTFSRTFGGFFGCRKRKMGGGARWKGVEGRFDKKKKTRGQKGGGSFVGGACWQGRGRDNPHGVGGVKKKKEIDGKCKLGGVVLSSVRGLEAP